MKGWLELMAYRIYSRIIISIIFIVPLFFISADSFGQTTECVYDSDAPSIEHARTSFKSLNYKCAEKEIIDFINKDTISLNSRADAHVLLAAIYYGMLKDSQGKKEKVVDQFKQAFRAFKDWQGELDIRSSEFKAMMDEAKTQVEEEPEPEYVKEIVVAGSESPSPKKPWISTAAFAGSSLFYVFSSIKASDKWSAYIDDISSSSLYDSYSSASSMRKIAGGLSIVTGIFSAYQWWQYFKAKKNPEETGNTGGLNIDVSSEHVCLTYNF